MLGAQQGAYFQLFQCYTSISLFFIVFPSKVHESMIYGRGYLTHTHPHTQTDTRTHTEALLDPSEMCYEKARNKRTN